MPITVVVLLLVGEAGARVVGPHLPRTAGTEQESVIKAGDIDRRSGGPTNVIFLGSSETVAGLIPRTFDDTSRAFSSSYNAALPAGLGTAQEWATRIVVPRLKPKVAVVGLFPIELISFSGGAQQYESRSDDAYREAFDKIDPSGLGRLDRTLQGWSALFRYRDGLRNPGDLYDGIRSLVTGAGPRLPDNPDPGATRAFVERTGENREYQASPQAIRPDPAFAKNMNDLATGTFVLKPLTDLLRSLRREGVRPVVALLPIDRTTLTAAGVDFTPLDRTDTKIQQAAAQLHVPVIDGFRQSYAPNLFHDQLHLDLTGARQWTEAVARQIDRFCATRALGRSCSPS
ncbi:MAG TPA: hypothetical protein VGM93_01405 [Acidimicrobiales bacterium]